VSLIHLKDGDIGMFYIKTCGSGALDDNMSLRWRRYSLSRKSWATSEQISNTETAAINDSATQLTKGVFGEKRRIVVPGYWMFDADGQKNGAFVCYLDSPFNDYWTRVQIPKNPNAPEGQEPAAVEAHDGSLLVFMRGTYYTWARSDNGGAIGSWSNLGEVPLEYSGGMGASRQLRVIPGTPNLLVTYIPVTGPNTMNLVAQVYRYDPPNQLIKVTEAKRIPPAITGGEHHQPSLLIDYEMGLVIMTWDRQTYGELCIFVEKLAWFFG
jgi:hypothetical protein